MKQWSLPEWGSGSPALLVGHNKVRVSTGLLGPMLAAGMSLSLKALKKPLLSVCSAFSRLTCNFSMSAAISMLIQYTGHGQEWLRDIVLTSSWLTQSELKAVSIAGPSFAPRPVCTRLAVSSWV